MANVNFYGPLQQALMGATPKLARRLSRLLYHRKRVG